MDWDKFDNALKAAREEAMVEADKLFAEFSAKHEANIKELRRVMDEQDKEFDELMAQAQLANKETAKKDIEKMLADLRVQ